MKPLLLTLIQFALIAAQTSVDTSRLIQHVQTLSQQTIPRTFAHPAGLDSAASYIVSELESYGCTVVEAPFEVVVKSADRKEDRKTETFRNIFCRVGPKDSSLIVIGAHYDVYDTLPGADDNASGVAGLLEIARILIANQSRLTKQVELVFFSLEEPPNFGTENMGSAVHANYHAVKKSDIDLMITLEMIGYFSDEKIQTYPLAPLSLLYPSRGDYIMVVTDMESRRAGKAIQRQFSRNTTLPCRVLTGPTWITGVDFSDHRNFWAHNFPAVMITNTAMYRNSEYHTTNDTWERLDYRRMSEVVSGVLHWVLSQK